MEYFKDTVGRIHPHITSDVTSAKDCSKKCLLETTCNYWSWMTENAGKFKYLCVLMRGADRFVWSSNAISGFGECEREGEYSIKLI